MIELALAFLIFGGFGLVMISLNRILGPRRTNPAKERPFECGSPPLQEGIPRPSVPYVLVAFVFLVFDVAVAFLFPWALAARALGRAGLLGLAAGLAIPAAGLVYARRKGFLRWE